MNLNPQPQTLNPKHQTLNLGHVEEGGRCRVEESRLQQSGGGVNRGEYL